MHSTEVRQKWESVVSLTGKAAANVDLQEAATVLEELGLELVTTRRHIAMNGVRGAPDWLACEFDLWQLSEHIREFLRKNRTVRGRNPLLDALARIARDPRYGKGRQNVVLMLGQFGRGEYGELLGELLNDPDVYGHAIKALKRGKLFGYSDRVSAILETEKRGWIRNAAKEYLSVSTRGS